MCCRLNFPYLNGFRVIENSFCRHTDFLLRTIIFEHGKMQLEIKNKNKHTIIVVLYLDTYPRFIRVCVIYTDMLSIHHRPLYCV